MKRIKILTAAVLSVLIVCSAFPACVSYADLPQEQQIKAEKTSEIQRLKKPGKTAVTDVTVKKSYAVISWEKDEACDGYVLYIATDRKFTKNCKKYTVSGGKTSCKAKSLKSDLRYYVKVKEYNRGEDGRFAYGDDSKVISLKYISAWKNCHVIRHACGMIDKVNYSNSKEALKRSLKKDSKAIEIDFGITSDGVLVCTHGFDNFKKVPTLSKFLKKKYKGKYTPMTAETALKLMAEQYSVYLVVDCQKNTLEVYRMINEILVKKGYGYYREHIVPQVYKSGEIGTIRKMYEYPNWIFTLYKMKDIETVKEYKTIANYCKKNRIGTVTMYKSRVTKTRMKIMKEADLLVGVHTVKTLKDFNKYRKAGGNVIYCDM